MNPDRTAAGVFSSVRSTLGDDVVAVLNVSSAGVSETDAQNYFGNHPDVSPSVTALQFHTVRPQLVVVAVEDGRLLLWNWKTNVAKEIVDASNPGTPTHAVLPTATPSYNVAASSGRGACIVSSFPFLSFF